MKREFDDANSYFGSMGERVLAFAWVYLNEAQYPKSYKFCMENDKYNFPMNDLCLIGLVSLNDPPKKYAAHSVTKCWRAGIKVVMITGDQPLTAAAMARKVNIISQSSIVNVDLIRDGINQNEAFERC